MNDIENSEIKELRDLILDMQQRLMGLQSDVRDLSTHVEYLKKSDAESRKKWWNVTLAFIGSVVSVIVVYVTSGGFDGK